MTWIRRLNRTQGWVGLLTPLKIDQGFRVSPELEKWLGGTGVRSRQNTKTDFYPERKDQLLSRLEKSLFSVYRFQQVTVVPLIHFILLFQIWNTYENLNTAYNM